MKQPIVVGLAAALGLTAAILDPCRSQTQSAPRAGATVAQIMKLDCAGWTSLAQVLPSLRSGSEPSFEVSVSFGEGEILALVDPETKAFERTLCDAETTYGPLRFKDGSETTVVWTRLSGAAGPLLGQTIASDGDVIALSIDRRPMVQRIGHLSFLPRRAQASTEGIARRVSIDGICLLVIDA